MTPQQSNLRPDGSVFPPVTPDPPPPPGQPEILLPDLLAVPDDEPAEKRPKDEKDDSPADEGEQDASSLGA